MIVENLKDFKNILNKPVTITIGNFDGVHIGHQLLINKVLEYHDTLSVLLTFNPNPKSIFNKDFVNLFSLSDKLQVLNKYKLDYTLIQDFNHEFMNLSKDEFILLLKKINVVRVVVGSDFRFGFKASGSVNDLREHFLVDEIKVINEGEEIVSTSLIKKLITNGDISLANKLLSYPYFIFGHIVHGNKVGRTLGFPTANIDYNDALIPSNGVYVTRISFLGNSYIGVTNVGNNPTVNYSSIKKVETFIIGFDEMIYSVDVKLEFIYRIRDEIKFNGVKELIKQMNNDIKFTKEYVINHNL